MAQDLKVGASVTIMATENVLQRFPHIAGTHAKIEHVPQHPSTWFTLRLASNNQQIKLQQTALKLLAVPKELKNNHRSQNSGNSNNFAVTDEFINKKMHYELPAGGSCAKVKDGASVVTIGRPRSNSYDSAEKRSRSNSIDTSHVHTLTLGAEVVIRATENVLQVCRDKK